MHSHEVDTSPLLHHLKRSTEDSSSKVGAAVPERTLEASGPGLEVAPVRDQSGLVLVVGDNLGELVGDEVRVDGLVSDLGEAKSGLLVVTLLDPVSGRLGEEEETEEEDESGHELDADGDSVRARVASALGGVGDARGDEETDGDHELVSTDHGSSDLSGRNLGHVEDDDGWASQSF